ncbi:hypothetical protein INR49_030900 [Caranx melampygus]|nr:hypothetical protein INR49_030900 [Caranx melampygus]
MRGVGVDQECVRGSTAEKGTLRRVTFSVVSQPQDGGCYDSGMEDSETPSSKSSSGPRLGALPLPEEGYERTTRREVWARRNMWRMMPDSFQT